MCEINNFIAGSKYVQNGTFEVTKAEDDSDKPLSPPCSPNPSVPNKPASALRVTVPSELQGVAFIEVLCQKGLLQFFVII